MTSTLKILTILGSPRDGRSNTRALVVDFVGYQHGRVLNGGTR